MKMKAIITLGVAVITMVLAYDDKFDKLDVDKILADDELFGKYINCWLDKGPCDMEYGEEFRQLLPEVVSTACSKCTPIQRQHIRKTVQAFAEKKPAELTEFRRKYDPKGEYEAALAVFLVASD